MPTPLIKVERTAVRAHKTEKSLVHVASYVVDDNGETVLNPIPEHQRKFAYDGKSLEISSLMFGTMPDSLAQVQMSDQQDAAEYITTSVVRRFGELAKQREELEKKTINNENV